MSNAKFKNYKNIFTYLALLNLTFYYNLEIRN